MYEELKAKACEHWQHWLPRRWANLVATNTVDKALSTAARHAEQEIRQWMERGARLDEAEEIVLPEWILLKPEVSGMSPAMEEEAEALEAEYQRIYGSPDLLAQ